MSKCPSDMLAAASATPQPPVASFNQAFIELAVPREAHHQLRDSVRELVPVDLPRVKRLAVGRHEILEIRTFGHFRNARGDQLAGFDFVIVAVPKPLLLIRQLPKPLLADDIFDADQPRSLLVGIEDDALMQIMVIDWRKRRRLGVVPSLLSVSGGFCFLRRTTSEQQRASNVASDRWITARESRRGAAMVGLAATRSLNTRLPGSETLALSD
jgi:hypothetical protein